MLIILFIWTVTWSQSHSAPFLASNKRDAFWSHVWFCFLRVISNLLFISVSSLHFKTLASVAFSSLRFAVFWREVSNMKLHVVNSISENALVKTLLKKVLLFYNTLKCMCVKMETLKGEKKEKCLCIYPWESCVCVCVCNTVRLCRGDWQIHCMAVDKRDRLTRWELK